jgi:UDP-MurNAc hydroxylase
MPSIEFINHASVLISDGNKSILSDPWYQDSVFNEGWDLLDPLQDDQIINVIERTDFIWISHEHPDHFSVGFFNKFKDEIIKRKITVLFQETMDKRVVSFLKSKKFDVIELRNNQLFEINSKFNVKILKVDFYDSTLIVNINNFKIANLNDCPFESDTQIKNLSKKIGNIDLMLNQFSYAAWKGGVKNINWRKKAALEKLKNIEKQSKFFNCKQFVGFASFIYFSNVENYYLNDSINTPQDIINYFDKTDIKPIIMQPFEKQEFLSLNQSQEAISFWEKKYAKITNYVPKTYNQSFQIDELKIEFQKYKARIYKKNSSLILTILMLFRPLNIFSSIRIRLIDLDCVINYSLKDGIKETSQNSYEVSLHSNSLMFIFKNEFGFDTLTVNGNFDCGKEGFSKMVKSFAVGSLNALGLKLSISALLNPFLFILLMMKLVRVKDNLED